MPERDRRIPEWPQCGVVNSITARYDWRKRTEVIASRRRPLRETVCDLVCVCVCSIYSVLCTEPHAAKIAMQQFASVSVTSPRQLWRPRPPSGLYEELVSTLVSAADMMRCPRRKVHRSIKDFKYHCARRFAACNAAPPPCRRAGLPGGVAPGVWPPGLVRRPAINVPTIDRSKKRWIERERRSPNNTARETRMLLSKTVLGTTYYRMRTCIQARMHIQHICTPQWHSRYRPCRFAALIELELARDGDELHLVLRPREGDQIWSLHSAKSTLSLRSG